MSKKPVYILLILVILIAVVAFWLYKTPTEDSFEREIAATRAKQNPETVLIIDYSKMEIREEPYAGLPETRKYYIGENGEKIPIVETHLNTSNGLFEITDFGPNQEFLQITTGSRQERER